MLVYAHFICKKQYSEKRLKEQHQFIFKSNEAARYCAMAHKVPTPTTHNFGIIVYQMRNR